MVIVCAQYGLNQGWANSSTWATYSLLP